MGAFGKRDIGRIECEFLDVRDLELYVSKADLLAHHETLLALVRRAADAHPHHATYAHPHHRTMPPTHIPTTAPPPRPWTRVGPPTRPR